MSDDPAARARAERLARALRDNLRRRKGAAKVDPRPADSHDDAVEPTRSDERPR